MVSRRNIVTITSVIITALIIAILMSGLMNTQIHTLFALPMIEQTYGPSQSASFALVGDLGCSADANQTLAQINATTPAIDRLLLLGDYSYRPDWKCFQNQLVGQGVEDIVRGADGSLKGVVVGNHEYNTGGSDHLNATGRIDFVYYFGLVSQNGVHNYSFEIGRASCRKR